MKANTDNVARPAGISFVAWSWIFTGGLLMLGAVFTFAAGGAMSSADIAAQLPPELAPMAQQFHESQFVTFMQLVIGVFAIIVAVKLLELRAWARTAAEALTWLLVVYIGVSMASWSSMFSLMSAQMAQSAMVDSAGVRNIGIAIAAVLVAGVVIPMVWMIIYLRSARVRELVRGR